MGTENKIFVVGNSWSGTTSMSRILGCHPNIFTFRELHFFEQLWNPEDTQRLAIEQARDLLSRLITIQRNGYLTQKQFQLYREEALKILGKNYSPKYPTEIYQIFLYSETIKEGGLLPCEQTPRNVYYIQEILEIFPTGYVINMIRDPRDVMLSQKNKWRRRLLGGEGFSTITLLRFWCNYHPITISLLWRSGIQAAYRIIDHPRVFNIKFEVLIESPESCIKDLCDRIGLEYVPEMIQIPQIGSSLEKDKLGMKPLAVGHWKRGGLNSSEIFLCQRILRDELGKYGYRTEYIQPSIFLLIKNIFLFPVKSLLALLFNFRRIGSIIDTLKRRFIKNN